MGDIAQKAIDAKPYQQPEYSYLHAMTPSGTSPGEAKVNATRFIDYQYQKVQDILVNGGDPIEALIRFTFASHPLQDSTSPAHGPWAQWSGNESWRELYHHVNEEARTPGPASNLYRATGDLFNIFFDNRPMPKDIFENYKIDPPQKIRLRDETLSISGIA
jgi:hypothetical protein